jgi:hypothetical protein
MLSSTRVSQDGTEKNSLTSFALKIIEFLFEYFKMISTDTDSANFQRQMIDSGLMHAIFAAIDRFRGQDIVMSKLARFLILVFEDGTLETQILVRIFALNSKLDHQEHCKNISS